MQITDTKIVSIPLSQLVCNEGQIDGVPANPRILRDEKYRALVASLRADNLTGINPLKVYWYETDGANKLYVVLGGNMRLRALQEIGATECPCIEIPQNTPTEVLRKIVVLDNSTFGEWDWDMLANEWDDAELKEWGLDVSTGSESGDGEEKIKGAEQFAEILNEENNYIVLQFRSEVDWLQAVQIFDLQPRKCGSYRQDGKIIKKNQKSGLARVLDGPTALNKLVKV